MVIHPDVGAGAGRLAPWPCSLSPFQTPGEVGHVSRWRLQSHSIAQEPPGQPLPRTRDPNAELEGHSNKLLGRVAWGLCFLWLAVLLFGTRFMSVLSSSGNISFFIK